MSEPQAARVRILDMAGRVCLVAEDATRMKCVVVQLDHVGLLSLRTRLTEIIDEREKGHVSSELTPPI